MSINTGWDINTIEDQYFFVFAEIFDETREKQNPNNEVGQQSMTDFINNGGISSIFEKGGKK